MTRARTVTVIAALAALALVAGTGGIAAAQQDGTTGPTTTTPTPHATATPEPTSTPTSTDTDTDREPATGTPANASDSDEPEYAERLDQYVVVESYTFNQETETWQITFEAEEPGTVTITAGGQFEEGSGTGTIVQERISRGTTTVTVPAPLIDGESTVFITSSRSIDAGRYVYLSTGQSGGNPFDTPGTMGWIGGASVVFSMGVWAFRKRLRGGSGGPEEVWD